MTNEQKFIICLIRKSFNLDVEDQVDELIDEEEVIQIIKRNGILLTVYPFLNSLQNSGNLKKELEKEYLATIKQSVCQIYEGERVIKKLSQHGFDCIALKGWENRLFYPNPNMRQMVDVDILVRPYNNSSIIELMGKLGYKYGGESSWKHDSFRKGNVHIEMHKRLTDDSDKVKQWESEMWNRAIPAHDYGFKMSIEDFYLFHFIHLKKDFLNGSLGLRRIIDTWLLLKWPKNEEFVLRELKRFGLTTFHKRMVTLARVLMGEVEQDENSAILLAYAFTTGIFGNVKAYKLGRIVSMSKNGTLRSGKINSLISAVFLPIDRMKAQFPILKRFPFLVPFFWIKRDLYFLNGDLKKSKQMLDYSAIKDDDYQKMKTVFLAGGYDEA